MDLKKCKNPGCNNVVKTTGNTCEDCNADRWGHTSRRRLRPEKTGTGKGTPVHILKISERAKALLENNGILTANDINELSDGNLLRIEGFGPFFLMEARKATEELGLFPVSNVED